MVNIYKRGQGKWIRSGAVIGLVVVAFFTCRQLYFLVENYWVFSGRTTAITTGPDGICESAATTEDVQKIPVGRGEPRSVAITPGDDGTLESVAKGDDEKPENNEFITTGLDGICDSRVEGDDAQVIAEGWGKPFAVCIKLAEESGESSSVAQGDDTSVDAWPKLSPYVIALVGLACLWGIFKLVNAPRVANFLIETEGEMKKVTWPGKPQVMGATGVVIVTVLILATCLFVYDRIIEAFIRNVIRLF